MAGIKFVHDGGMTTARAFRMDVGSGGTARLELIGSRGGGRSDHPGLNGEPALAAGDASVRIRWVCDAEGLTPIILTGSQARVELQHAQLELDLNALTRSGRYPLIHFERGGRIDGAEAFVSFIGQRRGRLQVDPSSGDLVVVVDLDDVVQLAPKDAAQGLKLSPNRR